MAESVKVIHPAHCAPGAEEAWKARVPGAEGYAQIVQEEDGVAIEVFALSAVVKVKGLEAEMTG